MKRIIAVTNQTGGVGITTNSINFSCGLALEGKRVLLIDMDPQAHSTIGMGIEPGSYQHAIHDVLLKKLEIENIILPTETENLYIVPSHISLDRAEQQLTPELFKETRLSRSIQNLDYDFIVIDCRPTLGTLTVNALFACDFIIVPCEMARYALEGFADLMDTIETVKNTDYEKHKFIRILINKYDARKKIASEWVMEQLGPYKDMLFETKIRQNEALNQAHIAMEPIFIFNNRSYGAEDYMELTKEFLSLCHQLKIS